METIELRTLKDIRDKIPKERLDAFLVDLKKWVLYDGQELVCSYAKIVEEMAKTLGMEVKTLVDDAVLRWVDDGQEGLTGIDLVTSKGEKLSGLRFKKTNEVRK